MHGKYLSILNPNNIHLKYNLHFYMMLVGSTRNLSEVQVRKEIMQALGLVASNQVLLWQKLKASQRTYITHDRLIMLCNYFNQHIPYLNLNSDNLLTEGNEAAKRKYLAEEKINPKGLGLSK